MKNKSDIFKQARNASRDVTRKLIPRVLLRIYSIIPVNFLISVKTFTTIYRREIRSLINNELTLTN